MSHKSKPSGGGTKAGRIADATRRPYPLREATVEAASSNAIRARRWPRRIHRLRITIIINTKPILHPLPCITMHVIQSPRIWQLTPYLTSHNPLDQEAPIEALDLKPTHYLDTTHNAPIGSHHHQKTNASSSQPGTHIPILPLLANDTHPNPSDLFKRRINS